MAGLSGRALARPVFIFLTLICAVLALVVTLPAHAQQTDAVGNDVKTGRPPAPQSTKPVAARPAPVTEDDIKRGAKEAPAVVAAAKVPCEITEARYVADASAQRDGKTVKGKAYEVACSTNQGFFLIAFQDGKTDVTNCNKAEALHAKDPANPLCALKGNRINHYWLTPLAKTVTPDCNVGKARWIAPNAAGDKVFYELLCKTGFSGIYAIANYDAADQTVGYMNCLKVEGTPLKCELSDHAKAVEQLTPLAQDSKDDCTVSDMRYLGGAKDRDYYEVGCATPPGFVIVLDAKGDVQGAVGCDKAVAIGGCKFTDVAAVKAEAHAKAEANRTAYAAALDKAGIDCSGDTFVRIGAQADTGRDVIEFKCPEQPNGLIAFVPAAKPDAQFESFDCFTARMKELPCKLTTEADLLARVKVIAKASKGVNPDCDVETARYAFMTGDGRLITELACVNKRGYIAVLDAKRTVFSPAVPCDVAAKSEKVPEKCTIPGNGSNTAK
ncbi:hypothetical protein [Asticcacaulis solisilvae]|uniref:hypothetical protein n=1 Tax=Asticcacaulis solisilvae TaxID=1217274 RepID=UPI003FD70C13